MFENIIQRYFSGLGIRLSKSFTRYTSSAISSCSFSTHEISRHLSKATGKDFNTSEKGLNYLLSNENFQVDDNYWRMHINLIFDMLLEQSLISRKQKIYIQVDFTSNENDFLILCASVIVNSRAVPLYFTMRNYPIRKNQYNQKKMESSFLKGLNHALSKKYQYVIVADRGFGNKRFIEECEKVGFEYLIRIEPNMKVKLGAESGIAKEVCDIDGEYRVHVPNWEKDLDIYKCSKDLKEWFLVSNIKGLSTKESQKIYSDRFKIEKCFQDMKSSGFDIEKSKIKKYARYKKLLAICMVAHALLVLLGHLIVVKLPDFLKNSALIASATLAYFQLEEKHMSYFQVEN